MDASTFLMYTNLGTLSQMGNKGAFIRFQAPEMKPQFTKFNAVVSVQLYLRLCLVLFEFSIQSRPFHMQLHSFVLVYEGIVFVCTSEV